MYQAYIKNTIVNVLALIFISYCNPTLASTKTLTAEKLEFTENEHYKVLSPKIRQKEDVILFTSQSEKPVQTLMFFSYACYWCSTIAEPFKVWAEKQTAVHSEVVPMAYNKVYISLAKTFYASKHFANPNLDKAIFKAIHYNNEELWKDDTLANFVKANKINPDEFMQIQKSFQVDSEVRKADELSVAFEITATPNIVVVGSKHIFITNLVMAQTPDRLIQILDHLVIKAIKAAS